MGSGRRRRRGDSRGGRHSWSRRDGGCVGRRWCQSRRRRNGGCVGRRRRGRAVQSPELDSHELRYVPHPCVRVFDVQSVVRAALEGFTSRAQNVFASVVLGGRGAGCSGVGFPPVDAFCERAIFVAGRLLSYADSGPYIVALYVAPGKLYRRVGDRCYRHIGRVRVGRGRGCGCPCGRRYRRPCGRRRIRLNTVAPCAIRLMPVI